MLQACQDALAAVERARALFGGDPASTPDGGVGVFTRAAHDTRGAAAGMGVVSGALARAYQDSAARVAVGLEAAAGTEAALTARMGEAAQITVGGAARVEVIAARVRALSAVAASANTAGAQRAVLGGLHAQMAALQQVVGEAGQQAAGLAGQVRASSYGGGTPEVKQGPAGEAGAGDDKPGGSTGAEKTDMSSGDITVIDQANRDMLEEMRRDYQQLPDGQVKTDRLADIAAIEQALQTPGSHLIYLEHPTDPSQMVPAATSVGDPFTADHVSTTVPGVSGTTRGAIAGMTREAAELRREAVEVGKAAASPENPISTDIAAVAWVGYQPPANLGQTSVIDDDLAQAGAPKLTSFLGEMDAASRNPGQTTALFGHSYGSLTSGIALGGGASEYVDNAVLYGSPGFQATSPADLGMSDDNFFVMATSDDPINYVAGTAPLHGWGANPNDVIDNADGTLRFRFEHLETDAGSTPIPGYEAKTGASGHSDYGRNAGERMTGYNLAAILLDRPDLTVRETPLSW